MYLKYLYKAGKMTQSVKCLLWKHVDPSVDGLDPYCPHKTQVWQHRPILPAQGKQKRVDRRGSLNSQSNQPMGLQFIESLSQSEMDSN